MGENTDLSRKAVVTAFGHTYYVVPAADDVVCLMTAAASGLCVPVGLVNEGKFSGTETCAPSDPSRYVQFGMLPDEAKRVRVMFADRSERLITVKNNVYAFTAQRSGPKPISLSWRGKGGQAVTVTPYVARGVERAACKES